MGKGEDSSADESEVDQAAEAPTDEENKPEDKGESPAENDKEAAEPAEEKKDVESLRKVIKVDQAEDKKEEEPAEGEEKPAESEDKAVEKVPESGGKESLEQKRAILQNIKDFDFQIKKNQEDLGGINKKIDGMSKDLDDLVSLYEIVSEQMNPFVGLSKVTKKRLDALENFTREIEALKERTGELESFAEKSGSRIQRLGDSQQSVKTIDTDAIIAQMDDKIDEDSEGEEGEKPEGTEDAKAIGPEGELKESAAEGEIPAEGKTETQDKKVNEEKSVAKTSEEKPEETASDEDVGEIEGFEGEDEEESGGIDLVDED